MSLRPGVTVVIPTIAPRRRLLRRALASVETQTWDGNIEVSIEYDERKEGAGPTRTRALRRVETEWTAFLDDDDYFYPHHLEALMEVHEDTGASICWGWWDGNTVWSEECRQGMCPDRCHRHKDFDFEAPHLFGITYLVKTELAQRCEFPEPERRAKYGNEDYSFILQLRDITEPKDWGHTPEITWHYGVHGRNTSGRPERW